MERTSLRRCYLAERNYVRCLAGAKNAAACNLRLIRQRLRELHLVPRMIIHAEITAPQGLRKGSVDSGLREMCDKNPVEA
jgi:hypothetical protein